MKKILSLVTLCLIAFTSQNLFAQDLNEIVNKHIQAVGGKDNWSKIKSMRQETMMKAQGAEIKITTNQIDKKGMRVDIEVMGMKGYQILTDNGGWSFMPFQGQTKPEAMTPDDVKNSQDDLIISDDFITYQELGKKIELVGSDEVEGTECFKVTLSDKNEKVTTYYIDKKDFQIIKEVSKSKSNGKEVEMSFMFSNFKKLDEGVVVAMFQSGDMGEMEVTKVEMNPKIDESIFKPSETPSTK